MNAKKPLPIPELLAPAGDEAALHAAVCAGADAVYLGYSAFSARASAANFDGEQLEKAIQYAHFHGVRVYVAVNTLVKEPELEAAYRALEVIAYARADAVIAQDLAVVALARQHFPTLEIHASTQMALHNATGVRWAARQGIKRVVLARECGLREIALAAQEGPALEVFVHGALCASVSGQCLLSSMAGGRSGNRGRCAQPCRQSLRLGERSGALLSLKDLCLREELPRLVKAGVAALKIEGRMKNPEYVAVVVDSYRRALDGLRAHTPGESAAHEREWLMQAYHRGGFTQGHAGGAQDAALADPGRVSHGGVAMGQVVQVKNGLATLRLTRNLHDGDSLQLRGPADVDLRYSGKDKAIGQEALLRLRPGSIVRVGDPVARLASVRQMTWAADLCRDKEVAVTLAATLRLHAPMTLAISDGKREAVAEGAVPEAAETRATTPEEVRRQLTKLGDTDFYVEKDEDFALTLEGELYVPLSSLNALRREAVAKLRKARCQAFYGEAREAWLEFHPAKSWEVAQEAMKEPEAGELVHTSKALEAKLLGEPAATAEALEAAEAEAGTVAQARSAPLPDPQAKNPFLDGPVVRFCQADQGDALETAGAAALIFAPWDVRPQAVEKDISVLPKATWLELPPVLTEANLQGLAEVLRRHKDALGGVVLGSVGQLGVDWALPIALGGGVPVTNRFSRAELLKSKPLFTVLWPEWSFQELKAIPQGEVPALLTVYGRERVMILHHCPERVAQGLTADRGSCALCQGSHMACGLQRPEMQDRKGYHFPLQRTLTPEGCLINVLNALPTDLRRQEDKRRGLGAGMLLSFTVEPKEEKLQLVRCFSALFEDRTPLPLTEPAAHTAGHLLRGVE